MRISIPGTLIDPAVRDLAWVIGSPGLADPRFPAYQGRVVDDAWCNLQLEHAADWLQALDKNPQPLHDYIAARPTRRLGHYFETLISCWLNHMPGTQLLASNLQVQQGQHTLGEYDFLFRDASGTLCHWEAAVKFYLQCEPVAEQSAFIGPGTRDRLDLKLDKIFNQQLALGDTAPGRQALPWGNELHRAEALIKGYLFYHVSTRADITIPGIAIPGISAAHLQGWWMRHAVDALPQISEDSHWLIAPRLRWLAPLKLVENAKVMTSAHLQQQLNEHFKAGSGAVLLVELGQQAAGTWLEISRGFVVCSRWPHLP